MRLCVLLLALALGLGPFLSPALGADETDVDGWIADLGSADSNRRIAAWQALRQAGDERAIPRLLDAMPAFDLMGRYYAMLVLESYPPRAALRPIRSLVEAADPFLRCAAGAWLWRQGEKGGAEAVVAALDLAHEVDAATRLHMVNRLHGLDDERVRTAVRAFLRKDADASLLGAVLQVLESDEQEATRDACRPLLEADAPADVRLLAAAFLYRGGEEEQKALLADLLEKGSITTTALYRVKTWLGQAGHVAPEILDAAAARLEGETQPYVLRVLVEILAEFGHGKAVGAIRKLVSHEDGSLSKAALEALVKLGGELDREDLLAGLEHEDADRRLAAAEMLRRADDLRGLPVVVAILRAGTPVQRQLAARALGAFRVRDAVDPLLDALEDEAPMVRSEALRALDALLQNLFPYRRLDLVAAGYDANAAAEGRREGLARIRAWWNAHRGGDW